MSKCEKCGGDIEFRHIDGTVIPLHQTGGCTGFVNPNAKCPVCGVRVYFYRSPHDGRVFFDALEPPWPKHPCTDNTMFKVKVERMELKTSEGVQLNGKLYEAERNLWSEFTVMHTKLVADYNLIVLHGKYLNRQMDIVLKRVRNFPHHFPIFLKSYGQGSKRIRMAVVETKWGRKYSRNVVHYFRAYSSVQAAITKKVAKRT